MARDRSTVKRCLAALALLEMLEEEDNIVTKRGKTRHWIKRRGEKGYFNIKKFQVSYSESGDFTVLGFSTAALLFFFFFIYGEIACTFF